MRQFLAPLLLAMACTLPGAANAKPIHEEMFVPIGGIEQWITITGSDDANPVVLFLHGGPGDAGSPGADSLFAGWDKDFTLVQWDQRGAGRTYGKSGPSVEPTMTIQRMTDDGIEIVEYLRQHLHKPKVILTGGSWGSVLGILMAHARPDLFYAYVGQAQVVNWQKTVAASYAQVLHLAEATKDRKTIAALNSIGPPPWKTVMPQWRIYRTAKNAYEAKTATVPSAPMRISPAYASPAERQRYAEADDFSFMRFFIGHVPKPNEKLVTLSLSGEFTKVDLPVLGTDFTIPIYMVEGGADLTAPPALARAYFDSIRAPRKQFFLVPGAGHQPNVPMLDVVHKILLEQVRPLAK